MKNNTALIALSNEGAAISFHLSQKLHDCETYLHDDIKTDLECKRFSRVLDLVSEIFGLYEGLIFIGACGVAVRSIAPHISQQPKDPAVVVVDVCARWVISLLSGHEGRANSLAVEVSNLLGAEPVITTTTQAAKTVIVGVGCKRGITAERVKKAISNSLHDLKLSLDDVRYIATVDDKSPEKGLSTAATELGIPLRLISSKEIMNSTIDFLKSDHVMENTSVPGVSEPSAMLAGRRTKLIQKRKNYDGISIAISRENCF